ncbi:MAG: Fe-S protein assembly co-chaperone HscB [Burkholderiales bacterium]|nr:Fe-S protein assembly co-chaperone HscB [Burkholderiales bacterium]
MQNHFELFQLPQQFVIDSAALDAAYREVQSQVHPDRFVSSTEAQKRVAMQWATRANEAYQTLKNPQKRAQYLCELNGVNLETESNTSMPAAFLMQQMEWRETLAEARAAKDIDALEALAQELRHSSKALLQQVASSLAAEDYLATAGHLRSLMFVDKFGEELETAFDLVG